MQQQLQDFRREKLELILAGLKPKEQETLMGLLAKAFQAAESKK